MKFALSFHVLLQNPVENPGFRSENTIFHGKKLGFAISLWMLCYRTQYLVHETLGLVNYWTIQLPYMWAVFVCDGRHI